MNLDAIFKAYDIRGLYPDEIDEEVAHLAGRAFVEVVGARKLLVGRDMRASSEPLSAAFISGAVTQGADVIDLGLCATDALYFASGRLDLPGVVFTASHNPAGYNGMKMVRAGAVPVGSETGMAEIKDMIAGQIPKGPRLGKISRLDIMADYVDHLLSLVDTSSFRPMKIVIDTANGMGGHTVPPVFEGLPFEVVPLFFELDGTFPNHPADPIQPENLVTLSARVVSEGAVCGIAFDGDADRAFFVDETGAPVIASMIGAMVADAILKRAGTREKVVYSLTCSRAVPEVIAEGGAESIRTRVGHSFIKKIMADTGAIFGVEHSGHFYFRDHWRADCGMLAVLNVLEVLSRSGGTLSEALAPFTSRYWNSGEINSRVPDAPTIMAALSERFSDARQDRTDGLTIDFEDRWFNVRASNTEPLLRLNVEHRDRVAGEAWRDELLRIIRG